MEHKTLRAQTILYHNEISSLKKSLESIYNAVKISKKHGGCIDFVEVYYGDASETPLFTEEMVKEWNTLFQEYLSLSYRFFGFNSGTSKGQNLMFQDCQTDYLMAYNPDVILCPRYFLEMMKPFERMDNVGMVEVKQSPLEHPKEFDIATGIEPWGPMACVIIPSAVYRQLGGLDEKTFFLYCDDVDFSWRLRLNGYKVVYQSSAFVYHSKYVNNQGGVVPTNAELYYSAEAALLMAHKWSNHKLLKRLKSIFENGSEQQRKALKEFHRRKAEGLLVEQLDSDHKIASFKDFGYSRNRY